MIKLNIIYDIKEKLKISSDDSDLTTEYISHLIDVKRATLIKQSYSNMTKTIPSLLYQDVCLTLEVAPLIPGMTCYGTILRTVEPLPDVLNISGREDLYLVRPIDIMATAYNQVPIERFAFLGNNRFLGRQIYTALGTDKRIYFYSAQDSYKFIENVSIKGVFESTSAAAQYSCDTACTDEYNSEYPLEGYMINEIVNLIVKELVTPTLQLPKDELNDADDERTKA